MGRKPKPRETWVYMGLDKRRVLDWRRRLRVAWHPAYSPADAAGKPTRPGGPWKTRREAQQEAASRGAVAVFVREGGTP